MMVQAGTQFDADLLKTFAELVAGEGVLTAGEHAEQVRADTQKGGLVTAITAIIEKVKAGKIELPVLPAVVLEIQKKYSKARFNEPGRCCGNRKGCGYVPATYHNIEFIFVPRCEEDDECAGSGSAARN